MCQTHLTQAAAIIAEVGLGTRLFRMTIPFQVSVGAYLDLFLRLLLALINVCFLLITIIY